MTLLELRDFILDRNDDELAKSDGHVCQVWEDGEISLQKSGDLLWRRNLHTMKLGFVQSVPLDAFPFVSGNHAYAFVTKDGADEIRAKIAEVIGTDEVRYS